jgi:hypothetical protein
MTHFVHAETPATHPGALRAEAIVERLRSAPRGFDGSRSLAALLLAAIVSSLLVVADKLMSTSEEGGLLVAWAVLWAVAFAGLAVFAGTARALAARVLAATRKAARRRAAARADEEFMAYAEHDPRILRDLQAIATRYESAQVAPARVVPARTRDVDDNGVPSLEVAMHRINAGQYY